MFANIFFLFLAVAIVVMVFTQVRNQKMKEKYAALWIIVSLVIIVLVALPSLLFWLADLVGVITPVNLLFLLAILLLIAVCLHLTFEVAKLNEDTRILAEEAAINRMEISEMRSTIEDRSSRQ